jgi:hypothetical protein
MLRNGAIVGVSVLAIGCAAKIHSQRVSPTDWSPKGNKLSGIIYYQPSLVKITHTFTTLVDDKGKVLGTAAEKTCLPMIEKEELQVWPDFTDPVVLLNAPSWLSNSKFSATLGNGMLQSVNSETSNVVPDLVGAVAEVITAAAPSAEAAVAGAYGVQRRGANQCDRASTA